MISDFQISKFRHFDHVELKQLKRVNLYVGKNSAGKSALLEAFLLFFTQASTNTINTILDARQEHWELKSRPALRHLFSNHTLPGYWEKGFKLSSTGDSRSFEAQITPYISDNESPNFAPSFLEVSPDSINEYDAERIEPFLTIVRDKGVYQRHVRLSRYSDVRRRYPRSELKKQALFVPTKGLNDEDVATLWDSISLTESEIDVINGLKLIEPTVEGVAFVGTDTHDRVPLVKLAGYSEPVSLKSLGDGMIRVLQIILSLVNAKESALIIDEFENGLHWGVQRHVWALVFRLANRLNVQVFASTHSRDCIYGFMDAWAEHSEDGAFARVEKNGNQVTIREYTLELLSDSLDTDVEVR